MKKLIALVLALVTPMTLAACGGTSTESTGTTGTAETTGGSETSTASGEPVSITIFNSKNEIQPDLEEAAAA